MPIELKDVPSECAKGAAIKATIVHTCTMYVYVRIYISSLKEFGYGITFYVEGMNEQSNEQRKKSLRKDT